MPTIENKKIIGHRGFAPNWEHALRIRPRSAEDDGQPLIVRNVRIYVTLDADALRIDTAYEYARGKHWQFSSVLLEDSEIVDVCRSDAGARAKLHCDALQVRQNGPKPIPVTIQRCRIEPKSSCDGCVIEGAISDLQINDVDAYTTSFKVKPGGKNEIPRIALSGGAKVIAYPGVKVIVWDGKGPEPKGDGGAKFKLKREPKKCPTCGQEIP